LTPGPADRVIAADYGAHHVLAWGWPLHLLIGDLDSLPAADLATVRALGTPTVTAPAAKDETDLELALMHALAGGARELVICAALGGRADHMLANVLLWARPELAGIPAVIADGAQTVRLLRGDGRPGGVSGLTLAGAPGDLLTLLPLAGDARGVTTAGLLYPLSDEPLLFGRARGISNVLAASVAQIWLREGLLLVIHTSQSLEPL
jgi:thiamine pyrophosphokinase